MHCSFMVHSGLSVDVMWIVYGLLVVLLVYNLSLCAAQLACGLYVDSERMRCYFH